MGVLELVTICFVVVRIMDKVDWSWWWVFSPLWLGYPVLLVLFVALASLGMRKISRPFK